MEELVARDRAPIGEVPMDAPWALTATAGEFSAAEREVLKERWESESRSDSRRVLLATCHRVELYGLGAIPTDHVPQLQSTSAVAHLLRVAAGIESAVTGEDEVLHQVRQGLADARADRLIDGSLIRLFETAIATGRRVRTGRRSEAPSLADRAVEWLSGRVPLGGEPVLVVGAGRMGALLARALNRRQAQVTIASRTRTRAERLARERKASAADLAEAVGLAPQMSAIAVALAGPWAAAAGLPPTADLSSPPAVAARERLRLGADFLAIDDLYDRSQSGPQAYVEAAQSVVELKTADYMRWLECRPRHRS